ncbi:methionyl-tRNA formyltransferase [Lacihabitans sp. CS3-21]|uniref:methionyl-tRNA formyltransferase n=1 Tax=Lacihabitans sp. CS3-21 TaxID=2487332 RepID=UPI0020CD8C2C|nr:formyltransferase family protein [Lacihabitans sp. CS3-21]MCP9745451.1 formyl transferase [Lacihabitans sp. CS3-21]
MRIVILTQDDPFYLGKNIDFLVKNMPKAAEIVGTVLFEVSPFGKRETFFEKMKKTFDVFGLQFFSYYSYKFIKSKFDSGNSVAKVLDKYNIPLIKIEGGINSKENRGILKTYQPDLLVSIGGNQIFKRPLLDLATYGCVNLHTALLPKYRGLMPSFWVLKNNEKYTGVSVFFVDEGIDSGPILVQKKVEIGDRSQEELIKYTKQIGMECIIESIELIQKGGFKLIPNPAEEMTYFSFPTRKDVDEFYKAGKRFF